MSWWNNVSDATREVNAAKAEAKEIRNASSDDVNDGDGARSTARQEAAHRGFWSAVAGKGGK